MPIDVTEKQLLVYEAYSQIAKSLQHHNSIQAIYRAFASTWLLATFFGIGYILSSKEVNLPYHPLVTIAFVSLASVTGIFLIWYMDLIVRERAIAANVFEGMKLEEINEWLPQFYHNVNAMQGLLGYIHLKAVFYIGCMVILFATMGVSLTLYEFISKAPYWLIIPFVAAVVISLIGFAMIIAIKKTDPYQRIDILKRKNLV